jgi:gas vesicle protein
MVYIHPRSAEGIRRLYKKTYGKGLGTFLKSGLNVVKSTTKNIAKAAAEKGKDIAKSAAGHAKEATKAVLKNVMDQGKELVAQAAATAMAEGQRAFKEHGTNLANSLANANSFSDIGNALKDTAKNAAQDLKDTATTVAQNTLQDAKERALDAAKHAALTGVQAGVNTILDSAGLNQPEEDGGQVSFSKLLAGNRGAKRRSAPKGGAVFLPGGSEGKGIYLA